MDDESLQMLSKADQLLAAVDESFIVIKRDHQVRPLPTFRYDEIALGNVLGTGGFGIVYEITNITIDRRHDPINENKEANNVPLEDSSDQNEPQPINKLQPQQGNSEIEGETKTWQHYEVSSIRSISSVDVHNNMDSHIHYKVHKAKDLMEKCCCRTSSQAITSRYALKRLQKGLTSIERSRGMLDLALEAKYLSIVWHPNISKFINKLLTIILTDSMLILLTRFKLQLKFVELRRGRQSVMLSLSSSIACMKRWRKERKCGEKKVKNIITNFPYLDRLVNVKKFRSNY